MKNPRISGRLTRACQRASALLALSTTLLLAACGSSSDGPVTTAPPVTTTPTAPVATTLGVIKPIVDCTTLAALDITEIGGAGSTITSATVVTTTVNGAAISLCSVKGTLAPSNTFAVALPVSTWKQRFAELGCGGLCGNVSDPTRQSSFSFSYNCPLVQEGGFVTAATDMGHTGNGTAWTTNTQQQADFAYRGQHITTLAAKKLIKAYYGQAQQYSYFVGCSDGGREALMAAQRYPLDYSGIIAGAPAAHFQIQNSVYHGWNVVSNSTTGTSSGNAILYADKIAVLHKAVVAACADTPDGLISDPRSCNFDPASIQCRVGATDTSACLTAAEVSAAGKIYGGPLDSITSERMQVGRPQFGSEINWPGVEVPATGTSSGTPAPVSSLFSTSIVTGAYNLIFTGSPTMPTIDTFGYNDASFYGTYLAPNHPLYDATNPDLSAFKAAGGKLILWHGWADQHISPRYTIAYYEAMQNTMTANTVATFARLYLVPGVGHCGGGEGNENIDLVTKITGWVEQSTAPDAVLTIKLDATGATTVTRPVYPYPAVAQVSGTGDWHSSTSYVAGAPLYNVRTPAWAGASFYTPYTPKVQGVAAP